MVAHYFNCVMAICVLCLFLVVPWAGLQTVVVAFFGHRPARSSLEGHNSMYINRSFLI